jgi:transposase-like protein
MIGPDRKQLSGLVEVDETFIGGAKSGKRGRGAEGKTLVLVAVEDHEDAGFGRFRLQTVPDASGKSLNNFIQTHIEPGSSVRTDGWRGYSKVDELGYEHIVSGGRDSEEAVGEDPSPLCHRVISLLKRSLLNPYQGAVHPAQLDRYLEEFAFRFNRRKSKSRGLLFLRLLQHAVRIPPFPAKEIQLGLRDYMRGTRKNKIVPSRDVFRPVDTAFLGQLGDLHFRFPCKTSSQS